MEWTFLPAVEDPTARQAMGLWLPPNRGNHSPGRGLGSPIVSQRQGRRVVCQSVRPTAARPPVGSIGPRGRLAHSSLIWLLSWSWPDFIHLRRSLVAFCAAIKLPLRATASTSSPRRTQLRFRSLVHSLLFICFNISNLSAECLLPP